MNDHRARVIEIINGAAIAALEYNLTPEGQANPLVGLDFVPGTADPVPNELDPIIEMRPDGAVLLRAYVAYRDEALASGDEWRAAWAKSSDCRVYGMLPEIATHAGLTERQRGNILQSCGRVAFIVGQRPTGMSDRDYAGQAFFSWDYKDGVPVAAIMDCAAYMAPQPNALPPFAGASLRDVRHYAQLHEANWIKQRKRVKG